MHTQEKTTHRFHGITADDMNNKARWGQMTKSDLEEWAELQNPNLMSIQWDVEEFPIYMTEKLTVKAPRLIARNI